MKKRLKRLSALVLALITLAFPLVSCSDEEEDKVPADYGTYGADFARALASEYPYRKAYSEQERMAGDMIKREFEELGYEVETQDFTSIYGGSSRNLIVRIEGEGFISDGEETDRIAVIGAHYDSSYGYSEVPTSSSYDGISDNASGIGCLMTIAKEIADYRNIGFDVILVAFGAGNDNYTGSRHFYNTLSQEDKDKIEVMYCIDSIYAGDKMYAHSGYNSLDLTQKYRMRRKLYQVYDVAYDSELASVNGYSLLYNESGAVTDLNGDGVDDVYREISVNKSDYVVFDEAQVPVVFFDSGDYFFDSPNEFKETKNLSLQDYGGMIRDTLLDSTETFNEVFQTEETDRLQVRINNTAFVIMESLMKGSDYAMTHEEYSDYLEDLRRESEDQEQAISGSNGVEG